MNSEERVSVSVPAPASVIGIGGDHSNLSNEKDQYDHVMSPFHRKLFARQQSVCSIRYFRGWQRTSSTDTWWSSSTGRRAESRYKYRGCRPAKTIGCFLRSSFQWMPIMPWMWIRPIRVYNIYRVLMIRLYFPTCRTNSFYHRSPLLVSKRTATNFVTIRCLIQLKLRLHDKRRDENEN